MNIKSLLLGSAAALAVVSGAQAADAIVAADPEPVEYVKVCDAYGTGYFYIPGTDTCLKVAGYVRFDVGGGFGDGYDNNGGEDWETHTRAHVVFDAKSDTEYGTLTSRIVLEANQSQGAPVGDSGADFIGDSNAALTTSSGTIIDEAYIDLDGFRVGRFASWWDNDFSGETDVMGNVTKTNSARYLYDNGDFYAGIALEDIGVYTNRLPGHLPDNPDNNALGIDGSVGGKVGSFTYQVYGGYDAGQQEGAVVARIGAEIGPGLFELAGIYSTDPNQYYDASEWAIAAQYAIKVTDKFTVTPGVQYNDKIDIDNGSFDGGHMWRAGATLDYQVVQNLSAKLSATYVDEDHADARGTVDYVEGFFRLQRDF
jgi:hypothetical protein